MKDLFTHQNIINLLNPNQELLDRTNNQAEYIHKILAQIAGSKNKIDIGMLKKMLYDAVETFTT